jgi:hypothetical protein
MRKFKLIGILLLLTLFAVGCASIKFEKYVYVGLESIKALDTTAGQVVARLYKDGKVNDADKAKFIEYSTKLKVAWDAAQAALATYVHTKSAANEQKLQVAFTQKQAAMGVFNEFYVTLIKGKE